MRCDVYHKREKKLKLWKIHEYREKLRSDCREIQLDGTKMIDCSNRQ